MVPRHPIRSWSIKLEKDGTFRASDGENFLFDLITAQ